MKKMTRALHLFVLRIWLEELGDGKKEWRGDIEHAATREKRYFREWSVLLEFLQSSGEQAKPRVRQGTRSPDRPNRPPGK